MIVINYLKVWLICLADIINSLFDPFSDFTRRPEPDNAYTLDSKAQIFEKDLIDNYQRFGGTIYDYQLPQFSALGDQALWHGVTTAMWALKGDMMRVSHCITGLTIHQPGGRLIRGLDIAGVKQEDASNDQATGHLMGLYYAWKYGTPGIKLQASFLLRDWAMNILRHNHCLVDADGNPTTYGKLIDGWKTDPLRLTLCLAIYAAAYQMTHETMFREAVEGLYNTYNLLVPYAKVKLLWLDNTNDAWRAAVHYAILDDIGFCTRAVQKGQERLYKLVKKQGNCLVELLLKRPMSNLTLLTEFTVNLKDNKEKTVTDYPTFTWGKEVSAKQPIPIWKRGGQDFMWQRNLYSARNWVGNTVATEWYNSVDFLICYYLEKRSHE